VADRICSCPRCHDKVEKPWHKRCWHCWVAQQEFRRCVHPAEDSDFQAHKRRAAQSADGFEASQPGQSAVERIGEGYGY
jgi:hypothetical protein